MMIYGGCIHRQTDQAGYKPTWVQEEAFFGRETYCGLFWAHCCPKCYHYIVITSISPIRLFCLWACHGKLSHIERISVFQGSCLMDWVSLPMKHFYTFLQYRLHMFVHLYPLLAASSRQGMPSSTHRSVGSTSRMASCRQERQLRLSMPLWSLWPC